VNGGVILVRDLVQAAEVANAYAPEHMQIAVRDEDAMLALLTNAGEILVGQWTPVSAANFIIGCPASLPTSGFAAVSGGITADAFRKRTAVARADQRSLDPDGRVHHGVHPARGVPRPRGRRAHPGAVTGSPPSARIRALVQAGAIRRAADAAADLITEAFGRPVAAVELTLDEYSLNSVSGRVRFTDGHLEFFKFHSEEGEEAHVTEYYRAQLLADAGLPVELPLRVAGQPGRQIALYELRTEPRMADVCADLERGDGQLPAGIATARRALDQVTGEVAVRTLRPAAARSSPAIHQLFWRRLTDAGRFPGGRYQAWYRGDPAYAGLADSRFVINGVEYAGTLSEIAATAARLLDPAVLAASPVVTAHGDDHQGNVWVLTRPGGPELRLFDPAFAGSDIPALLAPVKATFHNVFAHPFWLYHPEEAAGRVSPEVSIRGGVIEVNDKAGLSPLRQEIADSIAGLVWAPLLRELARRGELPPDWRATVRAALACCPLLVTNLMAPGRPGPVRYLGLARTVMAGSEPVNGEDPVSRLLDAVSPA
jgi:hypothetical protein